MRGELNSAFERTLNLLPGYIFIIGLDGKFIFTNSSFNNLVGFTSADEVSHNLGYGDMKCKASEHAEVFEKNNKLVAARNYTMTFLVYDSYASNIRKVLFGEKCPFFDNKGNISGVMCNVFDISSLKILDLGQLLINSNKKSSHSLDICDNFFCYIIEKNDFKYNLSPRQQECLFFIMRGKTAKMIAQELNISYKTVEIYIEQIKNKLNCSSKNELIEKAMAEGYMNTVPSSLFHGFRS